MADQQNNKPCCYFAKAWRKSGEMAKGGGFVATGGQIVCMILAAIFVAALWYGSVSNTAAAEFLDSQKISICIAAFTAIIFSLFKRLCLLVKAPSVIDAEQEDAIRLLQSKLEPASLPKNFRDLDRIANSIRKVADRDTAIGMKDEAVAIIRENLGDYEAKQVSQLFKPLCREDTDYFEEYRKEMLARKKRDIGEKLHELSKSLRDVN